MRGRISRTRSGKGEGVDAHEAAGWTEQEEGARAQGTAHPTRPEPAMVEKVEPSLERPTHTGIRVYTTRVRAAPSSSEYDSSSL